MAGVKLQSHVRSRAKLRAYVHQQNSCVGVTSRGQGRRRELYNVL